MAGYREFQTGEVLTAANVNDFLMEQSVMKFADAAARDTALGTAVGGANALREGMVAYLDSTDELLKYDGTAWGNVAPTSGQRFIAKASVSAVSSITFDDVFTADYQNYFVYMAVTGSASGILNLQFRAGGVNTTTSNYHQQGLSFQGTTVSTARTTGTSLFVSGAYSSTYQTSMFWVTRPQLASSRTSGWRLVMQDGGNAVFGNGVGPFDIDLTTQFDGFQLTPNTGTVTGDVYVYGFAEA